MECILTRNNFTTEIVQTVTWIKLRKSKENNDVTQSHYKKILSTIKIHWILEFVCQNELYVKIGPQRILWNKKKIDNIKAFLSLLSSSLRTWCHFQLTLVNSISKVMSLLHLMLCFLFILIMAKSILQDLIFKWIWITLDFTFHVQKLSFDRNKFNVV